MPKIKLRKLRMKRAKQIALMYKLFGEDVFSRVVQLISDRTWDRPLSPLDIVGAGFHWGQTEEGYDFWHNKYLLYLLELQNYKGKV